LEELEIKGGLLNTYCKKPKLHARLLSSLSFAAKRLMSMGFACCSGANRSWFHHYNMLIPNPLWPRANGPSLLSYRYCGLILLTSAAYHYCGAHDMSAVANSVHSKDGPSDITEPLLLPPTIAMGYMTSGGRCYCGARGCY
jgi:hypothetical protein